MIVYPAQAKWRPCGEVCSLSGLPSCPHLGGLHKIAEALGEVRLPKRLRPTTSGGEWGSGAAAAADPLSERAILKVEHRELARASIE